MSLGGLRDPAPSINELVLARGSLTNVRLFLFGLVTAKERWASCCSTSANASDEHQSA